MTETHPTFEMGRTARRAAANREAIVDAAEALLVKGGLSAVTVEAVAERADVAIQTVYNRVGRRPEVLVAVAERAVEENRRYMVSAFASPGTPLDRIVAVARAYVAFARERPRQFELLNTPPDEPDALERIAAKVEEQVGKLADILSDGVADGSIELDAEPSIAATTLWAMMEGVLALEWRTDRKVVDASAVQASAEFGLSTILNGLRRR
ncbi:TetR/AcrR family transcriptional regulator [Mycolicibacterium septicum]|nr:TetR/AcrR family transcriptional regulator [Mycolicibacterium septicum]